MEIRIGHPEREFLSIYVSGRSHPHAIDYWDGNWLDAKVNLSAGGFSGTLYGQVRTTELVAFQKELLTLYETLSGTAEFSTIENWIFIRAIGNGRGHLLWDCMVSDQVGGAYGNILNFKLQLDQTFIPDILRSLEQIAVAFPVLHPTAT